MSTSFSSLGCFLYNSDVMITFRPTDLPWPVAPATSRCGILVRSAMNTSLVMVLPSAIGRSNLVSWNLREFNMLSIDTLWRFLFGTSMPMVPLPGIGAIIRTPRAESRRAMSSSRLRILVMRIPSAGVISYRVIVGPTVALISRMSMPKLLSTFTISSLCAFTSSMSTYGLPSLESLFSRSSPG